MNLAKIPKFRKARNSNFSVCLREVFCDLLCGYVSEKRKKERGKERKEKQERKREERMRIDPTGGIYHRMFQ